MNRAVLTLFLVAAAGVGACSSDAGAGMAAVCGVPASFAWSSSGAVLAPKSDATHNLVSIKDPSIVRFNDKWQVFTSTVDVNGGYSLTVDVCHLQYLYQGLDPAMTSLPYNSLPWRFGLLTKTN